MADVESKSIPHELPSSHWLKGTGQCVLERYLPVTMLFRVPFQVLVIGQARTLGFIPDPKTREDNRKTVSK